MAYFKSIVTAQGAALLTDVMTSGGEVNIVAAAIGTGTPSGEPADMTALVSPVSVGGIILHEKYISQGSPTTLIIPVDVSNLGLTADLPVREIGIFAQGETGRILFAYSWYVGDDGDNVLPVPREATTADAVHTFEVGVFVTNQEAAAITVTVSDAAYVTAEQLARLTPEDIGAVSTHDIIQESDLIAWADKQTISGSFLVSPAITTVNVPTNSWFIGYIDIVAGGKRITMTDLNAYRNWFNVTREDVFSGWREFANIVMTQEMKFENFGEYYMLRKGRTLPNGKTHFLTMGLSSGGSTTLEHYTCDTQVFDSTKLDGRLELGQVAGENDWLNSYALVLRSDNANGPTYRIYGEHFSPAVVATATLTE